MPIWVAPVLQYREGHKWPIHRLDLSPHSGGEETAKLACMEPIAAISVIENDLRHLLDAVMSVKHGPKWLESSYSPEEIEALEDRQREETKRRAPARVPVSLLAYAHFYQLRKVIEKNWQDFSTALGEKKEFTVLADKVEDFRNAPAHSRELLHHERALLEGIAGTIRTSVTMFLSSRSPDAKHYPVIEWVRDSFGNEPGMSPGVNPIFESDLRLRVGDVITFDVRGWDPQGRELSWNLGTYPGGSSARKVAAIGTDASLDLVIAADMVGEHLYAEILMSSDGNYHRHTAFDHKITFLYAVDPPSF